MTIAPDDKLMALSTSEPTRPAPPSQAPADSTPGRAAEPIPQPQPVVQPWHEFVASASESDISSRFAKETQELLHKIPYINDCYCTLAIIDHLTTIADFELDRIYSALTRLNPKREKGVLLILHSRGGFVEPAYQISKICKAYAKSKFVVAVPRRAKSAATLIALGADEIHMGPLGQLGPIDPQLGNLPALGVRQALESLAQLATKYPGSSEMLARYLARAFTVEQIGYYERVSESSEQYAERLLSSKPDIKAQAKKIANVFVREFKDHGFVIDLEEARTHLGGSWIKDDSEELKFAESIYALWDVVNLFLGVRKEKRLLIIGGIDRDVLVFDRPRT